MKRWLLVVVSFWAICANGADWQKTLTSPKPNGAVQLRPLKAKYTFGWSAFTAADADFDFARPVNGALKLSVKTQTSGFVRTLWRMDARHTSQIRAADFRPVTVVQTETYKDGTRTTKLAFDGEGVDRTRDNSPPKPDAKKKTKRFKFDRMYDLHGALQMMRSQPLRTGEMHRLVVYASSAPYLAQITVMGREKIAVAGRKYDALRADLKLWRIDDDDLELKSYRKLRRANVWVSDDADRLLLKAEAEIFVGSVWAELTSVQFMHR